MSLSNHYFFKCLRVDGIDWEDREDFDRNDFFFAGYLFARIRSMSRTPQICNPQNSKSKVFARRAKVCGNVCHTTTNFLFFFTFFVIECVLSFTIRPFALKINCEHLLFFIHTPRLFCAKVDRSVVAIKSYSGIEHKGFAIF